VRIIFNLYQNFLYLLVSRTPCK